MEQAQRDFETKLEPGMFVISKRQGTLGIIKEVWNDEEILVIWGTGATRIASRKSVTIVRQVRVGGLYSAILPVHNPFSAHELREKLLQGT